jgi:molybdopterin converting factor small subunit
MMRRELTAGREAEKNKEVRIKLLGVFGRAYGTDEVKLRIGKDEKIREVIWKIARSSENFRRVLIDPVLESPLPNAVILINGKEISALDGLKTSVMDGDEITLIPVIHGG